ESPASPWSASSAGKARATEFQGRFRREAKPPSEGRVDVAIARAILCCMRLRPFRAWRPRPELVASVASPPYDVVSRAGAAALADGNPRNFLHVVRSEIDLPEDTDAHDPRVYAKARENLDRLVAQETLLREPRPALYLYRLIMEGRVQVGVVGCVHVDDYE